MNFRVELSSKAFDSIQKLDPQLKTRVIEMFKELRERRTLAATEK